MGLFGEGRPGEWAGGWKGGNGEWRKGQSSGKETKIRFPFIKRFYARQSLWKKKRLNYFCVFFFFLVSFLIFLFVYLLLFFLLKCTSNLLWGNINNFFLNLFFTSQNLISNFEILFSETVFLSFSAFFYCHLIQFY